MANKTLLEKAIDYSFQELAKSGGNIEILSKQIRIVIIITTAQGIIENGGFEYFFEADFPNNPPYSIFSDAYREIVAIEDADYLDKAVSLFPFKDPHLYQDKRNEYMKEIAYDFSKEFTQLGDKICFNNTIWEKLEIFVVNNIVHFGSM